LDFQANKINGLGYPAQPHPISHKMPPEAVAFYFEPAEVRRSSPATLSWEKSKHKRKAD
jgi:hypothetical protein